MTYNSLILSSCTFMNLIWSMNHLIAGVFYCRIDFPFLVFLASGGNCLLAVAKDVDDFLLIGTTDTSPGEAYDKVK